MNNIENTYTNYDELVVAVGGAKTQYHSVPWTHYAPLRCKIDAPCIENALRFAAGYLTGKRRNCTFAVTPAHEDRFR